MNIAQEIYESIQELYQEIIKVDLKTGKATILHSIIPIPYYYRSEYRNRCHRC